MRELKWSGYIDDEIWFGDEMTPDTVNEALRGENGDLTDDVHVTLNSYGGSVDAATRIFDTIRAYPGKVHITVSGTAASAAVGMVMAADELDMTPGSMMMIHDPSMMAWGNEADMQSAIRTLKTAKDSILNIYEGRVKTARDEISAMMTAETWMDSKEALKHGFVDAIAETGVKNSAGERVYDRAAAEKAVKAFYSRKMAACAPKARDEPGAKEPDRVNAREMRLRMKQREERNERK